MPASEVRVLAMGRSLGYDCKNSPPGGIHASLQETVPMLRSLVCCGMLLFGFPLVAARVFHTTLGHSPEVMRCVGFIFTLQRGAEWAATGKVTQTEIPDDFPTSEKVSVR